MIVLKLKVVMTIKEIKKVAFTSEETLFHG